MQTSLHISLLLMNLLERFERYVKKLYGQIRDLENKLTQTEEQLEKAEAEIRRLKKLPKKPDIKASELDKPKPDSSGKSGKTGKRPGSDKESKKKDLKIHETKVVEAEDVPSDWEFVGYQDYVIQDFVIRANNIAYQREVWKSPDGQRKLVATLPAHLINKHFGTTLQGYILQQYYECGVTQPLIRRSLLDFGVSISMGQINNILIENKETFHQEKESLLAQAIELKEELRTDDTLARHRFKNGSCNCINSDLFTYFTTTYSKSRINFLRILRMEHEDYVLNQTALDYAIAQELPQKYYLVLSESYQNDEHHFADEAALNAYFNKHRITAVHAVRTIREALLMGAIVEHGFDPQTLIHSDGARQFAVFVHSLCWKHAERPLVKLKPYDERQAQLLETKKEAFWTLYQALKKYKQAPDKALIPILEQQFDQLCESVDGFDSLNQVLQALKKKKDKLLLVLKRPRASLHNNDSERDIREYAKRRKISAGTRSENGKKARDTFLSLKKTCRKLGISFWEYLIDRLNHDKQIPPLSQMMAHKARTANG